MIRKETLEKLYVHDKYSMQEIAAHLDCSLHKIAYWMDKHSISRRSRSEANYQLYNSNGDPFKFRPPDSPYLCELYGMGLGLYWGEGNKTNKNSVRLGNTDVYLIKKFIEFLQKIYCINDSRLKFSVQIFNDIDPDEALKYWSDQLGYGNEYFQKPHITKSGSIGTYSKKSKYGVLTIHFYNTKLRNILVDSLPKNGVKYNTG